MPVQPTLVKEMIEKALPGAQVEVVDLVGDNDHLRATVVAGQFEGKTLLEQHQLVYAALGDALRQELHALQLKTYSPAQFEQFSRRS